MHSDNALMLQILQNGDFVVHGQDGVVVATEEFFLENFDCGVVLRSKDASQVDLGGVAFAERLQNFVFVIEHGVFGDRFGVGSVVGHITK